MSRADAYTLIARVESESEPGKLHEVKSDGTRLSCACHKWRFMKGEKWCHHVRFVEAQLAAEGYQMPQAIAEVTRIARASGALVGPGIVVDPIRAAADSIASTWRGQGAVNMNIALRDAVEAAIRRFAGTSASKPLAPTPSRPDWIGGGRAILLRD